MTNPCFLYMSLIDLAFRSFCVSNGNLSSTMKKVGEGQLEGLPSTGRGRQVVRQRERQRDKERGTKGERERERQTERETVRVPPSSSTSGIFHPPLAALTLILMSLVEGCFLKPISERWRGYKFRERERERQMEGWDGQSTKTSQCSSHRTAYASGTTDWRPFCPQQMLRMMRNIRQVE